MKKVAIVLAIQKVVGHTCIKMTSKITNGKGVTRMGEENLGWLFPGSYETDPGMDSKKEAQELQDR
jgi:hypothetical protein